MIIEMNISYIFTVHPTWSTTWDMARVGWELDNPFTHFAGHQCFCELVTLLFLWQTLLGHHTENFEEMVCLAFHNANGNDKNWQCHWSSKTWSPNYDNRTVKLFSQVIWRTTPKRRLYLLTTEFSILLNCLLIFDWNMYLYCLSL